jgi:L-lactate dehydrogenase complex protein LldE
MGRAGMLAKRSDLMSKVSLFIPCAVDVVMVSVGEATVRLLARLGFDLQYHEEQTCCGQPTITAGHLDLAKKAARRFISIFEQDEVIVSPSGSCVSTIRNEYPRLFADEPQWQERAQELGQRVYELSEFLVDVAGIKDVDAHYNGKLAYHKSCHILRALGIDRQPQTLLENIHGAELVPMQLAHECCGFGGQFSVKYPYISEAIVRDKVKNFLASEADLLVLSDPGCLLNIRGYLHRHHPGRQVKHLAEVLAGSI